jgi:HK97 family phage prohead protease
MEVILTMQNKPERRFIQISSDVEIRAKQDGNKKTLEGYAAVFNQRSDDLGFFFEYVRPGAFTKTIQESDIRALFNHNPDKILGRNKAGTLKLLTDSRGLEYKVDLPDTTAGKDAWESVDRGDITQNSFGFRTVKDNWFTEDMPTDKGQTMKATCRELLEAQLYDISPVTYPAYPQTSVSARDILGKTGLDLDSLTAILFRKDRGFEVTGEEIEIIKRAIGSLSGIIQPSEPEQNHSENREKPGPAESDLTLRRFKLEMMKRGLLSQNIRRN